MATPKKDRNRRSQYKNPKIEQGDKKDKEQKISRTKDHESNKSIKQIGKEKKINETKKKPVEKKSKPNMLKAKKKKKSSLSENKMPFGKKKCVSCLKLVDKNDAMCIHCDHVFPESRNDRFMATSYYRAYQTDPDYNEKKPVVSKD